MEDATTSQIPAYPPEDPDALNDLLSFMETAPFKYGTWRDFKHIYKTAEADPNASPALIGAMIARIDTAVPSNQNVIPTVTLKPPVYHIRQLALGANRLYILDDSPRQGSINLICYKYKRDIPNEMTFAGSIPAPMGDILVLCGQYAVVASKSRSRIMIFDCSDPANMKPLPEIPERVDNLISDDRYIYFSVKSDQFTGIYIVSLTSGIPQVVSKIPVASVNSIAVHNNYLCYTTAGQGLSLTSLPKPAGLRILDISVPNQPKQIGSLNVDKPGAIGVFGNLIVISKQGQMWSSAGIHIIDIKNPSSPNYVTFFKCTEQAESVKVLENTAYLKSQYGGFIVVNLKDMARPRIVSRDYLAVYDVDKNLVAGAKQGSVSLFDAKTPYNLVAIGKDPSRKTLFYMKRRARRFLKYLEKTNPERFVQVAAEVLKNYRSVSISNRTGWVAMELLFGGSRIYRQTRHSRGNYVLTNYNAKLPLTIKLRTERGQAIWNRHPEYLEQILLSANAPWQAHEMAYKALVSQKLPLPEMNVDIAAAYVAGYSPILRGVGARIISSQLQNNAKIEPETVADAFISANKTIRQSISEAIAAINKKPEWRRKFASRLFARATEGINVQSGSRLPRRRGVAFGLIAQSFLDIIPFKTLSPYSAFFLSSGQPALIDIALAAAKKEQPSEALKWLQSVINYSAAVQSRTIEALAEGMNGRAFNLKQATQLVYNSNWFIRQAGWRLLEASATPNKVLKPLWQTLLQQRNISPELTTAMGSASALSLLSRSGIDIKEFAGILRDKPQIAALMTADAFASISKTLSLDIVIELIAAAPDELWNGIRLGWLRNLRETINSSIIWQAVAAGLSNEGGDVLQRRLLDDTDIAYAFVESNDENLLDIYEPAFSQLLLRWVEARIERFDANSPLLLKAATHRLPNIRDWALNRVKELGMDLPFALRLLESELPASFEAGRVLFEIADSNSIQSYALALCDSPSPSVRGYARYFVNSHWDKLEHNSVLISLVENSTPDMQAFTASLLSKEAVQLDTDNDLTRSAAVFDREVLRTRYKARRAKETVKQRQDITHSVDIATLMAMARSRSSRDAEWAMSQLAQRALIGETIDGVTIEGAETIRG